MPKRESKRTERGDKKLEDRIRIKDDEHEDEGSSTVVSKKVKVEEQKSPRKRTKREYQSDDDANGEYI